MKLAQFILLLFALTWLSREARAQDKPIIYYEGSSTISNFIKDAEPVYGKVKFVINTESESAGGELAILEGRADIGGVAKVPSPQVLGKGIASSLIGWDAIVVVVNNNNPISNLTKEQLKGIFTNKITNWKDLGGPDLPIQPYIVDVESATRKVFRSRLLGQDDYIDCEVVAPDSEILTKVNQNPGAIGQISFSFVHNKDVQVKSLSIDGHKSSVENQNYPITRPLYLIWWPGRQTVADFAEWTHTTEAQKVITQNFIAKTQNKVGKSGKLIVYSNTLTIEEGGTYFYPHEAYEIYSKDGTLLQKVQNHLELTDENPSSVTLEPNQYLIWTESAKSNNESKILVVVESDETTRVSIGSNSSVNPLTPNQKISSAKNLKLYGDFRFRVEQDWDSRRSDGTYRTDRRRMRYRLRFGFNYKINHLLFGGRLRSGNLNNSQSPHTSFGSSNEKHSIGIDKAFVKFGPSKYWIWLGKNNLPFWKENEFWWDDDITPEGVALGGILLDKNYLSIKPTFGYFLLDNIQGENQSLLGGQLKLEATLGNFDLNIASGYYYCNSLLDRSYANDINLIDYKMLNSRIELKSKSRFPVIIGLEYLQNFADYSGNQMITENGHESEKGGYVLTLSTGNKFKKNNLLISYYYAFIPKYSVVNHLSQDDWVRWDLATGNGTRSSNFKGHEFRVSYSIGKSVNLVARAYIAEAIKKERHDDTALETGNRVRFDCNFKF